jgi:hypothetical protein
VQSRHSRATELVGMIAVALLMASACTNSPAPVPTGSPAPTATRSTGSRDPRVLPLTDVSGNLAWTDLGARPSRVFAGVGVVSVNYIVVSTADKRATVVRRRSDNRVVLTHTTERPEYVTDFADIAGDTLVIVDEDDESNSDGTKDPAHPYIYDLRTGKRTALSQVPGAPPPSVFGPQATVTDDGHYYYSASVNRTGNQYSNCVGVVDLTALKGSIVECAGSGENESDGYYLGAGEDGATWLHVAGPTIESCRTGRGIRHGQLITVGPATGCATLGTATVGGWSLWTATPIPAGMPVPDVDTYATDGSATVELGPAQGVSLTMCGQYAYWQYRDDYLQTEEIRRWKPGMTTVEIARKLAEPDNTPAGYVLAIGGCADDIVTALVFTDVPGVTPTSTLQLLALAT